MVVAKDLKVLLGSEGVVVKQKISFLLFSCHRSGESPPVSVKNPESAQSETETRPRKNPTKYGGGRQEQRTENSKFQIR